MARISLVWVFFLALFLRVPSARAETVSTKTVIHHPVLQGITVVDPPRWPVLLRVSSTGPVEDPDLIARKYGTNKEAIRKGNMGMTIAYCDTQERLRIPRNATAEQVVQMREAGGLWNDCAKDRNAQRLFLIAGSTIEVTPGWMESPTTTKLQVAERLAACTTADCATKVAESVNAVIPVIPDPMPFARAEIYRLEAEKNALQLERSDARIHTEQLRSELLHWGAATVVAICLIALLVGLLWRKRDEVRALRKDQLYTRARLAAIARDRDALDALAKAGEDEYVRMRARYDVRIVELNDEHRRQQLRAASEHERNLREERVDNSVFVNELHVAISGIEVDLSTHDGIVNAKKAVLSLFDKRNLEIASVSDSLREVIIGEDRMRSYSYQPFDQRSNVAMVNLLTELKNPLARCLNVNPESVSLVWLVQEVTKQLESGVPSPQAELPPTTLRVPNIRRDAKYAGSEGTTLKPLPTGVAPAPGGQVVSLRSVDPVYAAAMQEEMLHELDHTLSAHVISTQQPLRIGHENQLKLALSVVKKLDTVRFEFGGHDDKGTFQVSLVDLINPVFAKSLFAHVQTAG